MKSGIESDTMTETNADTLLDAGLPRLPLFYRDPRTLVPERDHDLRLVGEGYDFASDTNAVPLAAIEFASAMRHYPVVFAETDGFPVALLGLERTNRFVERAQWAPGYYVPAYIRRYPFVFADTGAGSFALAVDMGSDRIARGGKEGMPLFERGELAAPTAEALAFCRDFHGAHIQTRAFVEALHEQDLLISQIADARLPSGEPMTLSGFKVVDRSRFEALGDDLIVAWHKRGWLSLIHFHLASLDRFADLPSREPAPGWVSDTEVGV